MPLDEKINAQLMGGTGSRELRIKLELDSSYTVKVLDANGKPVVGNMNDGTLGGHGVAIAAALSDIVNNVIPVDYEHGRSLKELSKVGITNFDLTIVAKEHQPKLLELYKGLDQNYRINRVVYLLVNSAVAPWHTDLVRDVFDHYSKLSPKVASSMVSAVWKRTPNAGVKGIVLSKHLDKVVNIAKLPVTIYKALILYGDREICERCASSPTTPHGFSWAVDRAAKSPEQSWIFEVVGKDKNADPDLGVMRALRTNKLEFLPVLKAHGGDVDRGIKNTIDALGKNPSGPSYNRLVRVMRRLKTMDLEEAIVEEAEADVGIDLI